MVQVLSISSAQVHFWMHLAQTFMLFVSHDLARSAGSLLQDERVLNPSSTNLISKFISQSTSLNLKIELLQIQHFSLNTSSCCSCIFIFGNNALTSWPPASAGSSIIVVACFCLRLYNHGERATLGKIFFKSVIGMTRFWLILGNFVLHVTLMAFCLFLARFKIIFVLESPLFLTFLLFSWLFDSSDEHKFGFFYWWKTLLALHAPA